MTPFYSDITVIIKSFLRNKKTRECFKSWQKRYPGIKFVIIDDGYPDDKQDEFYDEIRKEGHVAIRTEFDIGLAAGRNLGIKNATTKYVLMVDNDHFAFEETKLEQMYDVLQARMDISIVGGRIFEDNPVRPYPRWEGFLNIGVDGNGDRFISCESLDYEKAYYAQVFTGPKFTIVDITHNFLLFRRSVFPHLHWDETFKVCGDHVDFFLDAKARQYRVVFMPDSVVHHCYQEDEDSPDYAKFRGRKMFLNSLASKWNVKYYRDFFGIRHDFLCQTMENTKG